MVKQFQCSFSLFSLCGNVLSKHLSLSRNNTQKFRSGFQTDFRTCRQDGELASYYMFTGQVCTSDCGFTVGYFPLFSLWLLQRHLYALILFVHLHCVCGILILIYSVLLRFVSDCVCVSVCVANCLKHRHRQSTTSSCCYQSSYSFTCCISGFIFPSWFSGFYFHLTDSQVSVQCIAPQD